MNAPKMLAFLLFIAFLASPFAIVVVYGGGRSGNISFDFESFLLRNFTLLGDSYLRNGVIGLTRELGVPSTSSGAVIYNNPIALFDPATNVTASFAAKFSFSIASVNPSSSYGDGLAFFLAADNRTLGTPGLSFGLVNSTTGSSSDFLNSRFVAVEFDTRMDTGVHDPNDNHVGLDIDSLVSVKISDPALQDIDLKSGNMITAWIEYKHDVGLLRVYMSYSSLRPLIPVLSVSIDLSGYLKESMYVGFSASTEGSTELHLVENWGFQTYGFPQMRPRLHPHNVSDQTVDIRPPISVPRAKGHNKLGLGLGIAGPGICFVALVVFGYISLKRYHGMKIEQSFKAELLTGPKEFSYREVKAATKGFHSSRVIGHGAFGTVYKAFFLSTGTIAAVKRSKHTHEGKTEFLAELSIIACLRHKNLLQLQGWCVEKGELLLVYEFMPNGSLDRVLYQESDGGTPLKWAQRYNIAVGMASALAYLHQECEQQVIHRDIKTSNIMLDGNFNARLGDFGLARIMDHDKSPVSTLTAGTMGYLAPEYLQYGIATEKTDVFSYGVVILEVACGRRPIEKDPDNQNMINLVDWVWGSYSEGRIIEAADKRLNREFRDEDMRKLLLIGLSCANPDANERPNMRRVLQILNGEADPVFVPKTKPTLTFSNSLPLTLDEIVSDDEDGKPSGPNSPFEIRII